MESLRNSKKNWDNDKMRGATSIWGNGTGLENAKEREERDMNDRREDGEEEGGQRKIGG